MSAPRRALVVVAKEPTAGRAKTRLAAAVGAERAAELAAAFLADTLAHAARVPDAARVLYVEPPDACARLAALDPGAEVLAQPAGDLGARLAAVCAALFARGLERVALVGADAPHVGPDALGALLDAADRAPIALGPAEDGGYWGLALAAPCPELFVDVPWSGPRVLDTTRERARAAGRAVELVEPAFDVDTGEDLERLRALLAERGAGLCPRTAALLALPAAPGAGAARSRGYPPERSHAPEG